MNKRRIHLADLAAQHVPPVLVHIYFAFDTLLVQIFQGAPHGARGCCKVRSPCIALTLQLPQDVPRDGAALEGRPPRRPVGVHGVGPLADAVGALFPIRAPTSAIPVLLPREPAKVVRQPPDTHGVDMIGIARPLLGVPGPVCVVFSFTARLQGFSVQVSHGWQPHSLLFWSPFPQARYFLGAEGEDP